jgi:thioredoxin-like negative regulator of GroEL
MDQLQQELNNLNIRLAEYPDDINARLARARIYEDIGRAAEAIQEYEDMITGNSFEEDMDIDF